MSRYTLLWGMALAGLALHLVGLGWDAYLHSRDATLAAREGVFTLSNPGHLLVLLGMAVMASSIVGVAMVWMLERPATGRPILIARLAALPVVVLFGAASVWMLSLAEDTTHDHSTMDHDDPALVASATQGQEDHAHAPSASQAQSPSAAASAVSVQQGGPHIHGTEVAVTPAQLAAAANFYSAVKTASEKYEDIRVAMANGYIQVTQDLPAIAAHFVNLAYNADGITMDPERPETLLYSKRVDGTWRLVGVMFSSETTTPDPPSHFGPLDAWHYHENLCFTANAVSVRDSQAACRGGIFIRRTAWMLHVWTMPGSEGAFAHDFAPINPGTFPPALRSAAAEFASRP